ncbi:hypothetical protein Tco_0005130 [Tanacetum coccineum]
MDDETMWAADRVIASTPVSAITIPKTTNEFAIKGTNISKITRKPSKMGKHGHEKRKSTREPKIQSQSQRESTSVNYGSTKVNSLEDKS